MRIIKIRIVFYKLEAGFCLQWGSDNSHQCEKFHDWKSSTNTAVLGLIWFYIFVIEYSCVRPMPFTTTHCIAWVLKLSWCTWINLPQVTTLCLSACSFWEVRVMYLYISLFSFQSKMSKAFKFAVWKSSQESLVTYISCFSHLVLTLHLRSRFYQTAKELVKLTFESFIVSKERRKLPRHVKW